MLFLYEDSKCVFNCSNACVVQCDKVHLAINLKDLLQLLQLLIKIWHNISVLLVEMLHR